MSLAELFEVGALELVPVGGDDEGVGILEAFVHVVDDRGGGAEFGAGVLRGDGVEADGGRAVADGLADEGECGGFADVVGAGLEGDAPEGDLLALEAAGPPPTPVLPPKWR
jgi:hypothetical protein